MTNAFVFPGQGSQAPGMGRSLAEHYPQARAIFEEVDDALGEKLSTLIFEGPEDRLTLTANAQPAIMAVSLAAFAALQAEGIDFDKAAYAAGHSLGEYSALTAAGSITLADTARLLRIRGEAMQKAVPVGEGAMAALIGLDEETVSWIVEEAAEEGICVIANDNAPDQVVVSGEVRSVERALEIAKARRSRASRLLPVSAPFHSPLMAPAAEAMAEALRSVTILSPKTLILSNVTCRPIDEPEDIRQELVAQVTATVCWRETISLMKRAGVHRFIEIGPGRVLSGLTRRIVEGTVQMSVGTPEEVRAAAAALAEVSV